MPIVTVASISLRFFCKIFGRMHTRQPSRTSNKRARSGILRDNKGKNRSGFEPKDSFCLELRSAKDYAKRALRDE